MYIYIYISGLFSLWKIKVLLNHQKYVVESVNLNRELLWDSFPTDWIQEVCDCSTEELKGYD